MKCKDYHLLDMLAHFCFICMFLDILGDNVFIAYYLISQVSMVALKNALSFFSLSILATIFPPTLCFWLYVLFLHV